MLVPKPTRRGVHGDYASASRIFELSRRRVEWQSVSAGDTDSRHEYLCRRRGYLRGLSQLRRLNWGGAGFGVGTMKQKRWVMALQGLRSTISNRTNRAGVLKAVMNNYPILSSFCGVVGWRCGVRLAIRVIHRH